MMAGNTGNAWQETFLATISQQSGTDATFEGITETLDFDFGEKDFDGIPLGNGGRIEKLTPEGPTTVTIEAYPLEVGSDDISGASTINGFFDLLQQEDTSHPLAIQATTARTRYRLAIMWTDDTSISSATAEVGSTQAAMRFVLADGFITSVKPSFTDGILKFTITFKVVPFDISGNSNMELESVNAAVSSATMAAVASYTSSTKF